ncbi:MAG: DUF167 domain-containing protein [Anaerohalosphaeraceae bacterium]|nr:DUF167 domain-containing protein [Anaerohalosphaeraceae bacterium]
MMAFEKDLVVTAAGDGSITFGVKVVPGSSRTTLAGFYDGMLKVKISAPPEKGKANKALLVFLADKIGISKNLIAITSGQTSPIKRVTINSITVDVFLKSLQNCQ